MPRGENTADHPGRQVGRARWEIVPATRTGESERSYSLVGHGNVQETARSNHPSFGTHSEAVGYMGSKGLDHYSPEREHPASDKGWQT
jgi:hypothetical protein